MTHESLLVFVKLKQEEIQVALIFLKSKGQLLCYAFSIFFKLKDFSNMYV